MLYTVPNPLYLLKSDKNKTTSTLRTSVFDMKNEHLTSPIRLRVDDLKVCFVDFGFQKNTNKQAQRYYHLILRMGITQTLSNSRHNFGHRLSMNVFKVHSTVCNQRRNDDGTSSAIIRRMHTRQFSHL